MIMVDVLIIGSGASGAAVAWRLAVPDADDWRTVRDHFNSEYHVDWAWSSLQAFAGGANSNERQSSVE
jgi:cation diffusion facilitator CzcD-associated flavoprotein CzcO